MKASIEMPGIKGLWSLRASGSSLFDQYLVQSYIGETRVLSIDGEEMGEVRDLLAARSAL
jgi:DNA damage-binding protein 1